MPPPPKQATPAPDTTVVESGGNLAIGITEPNPAFVHPTKGVPAEFEPWRGALQKMRPHLYRLVIDWPGIASPDGATLDLSRQHPGCMRDIGPCAPWDGVKAQLEAVAAAQEEHEGRFEVLLVVSGTPEGLSIPPGGCERAGAQPRSRPPSDEKGIPAYKDLLVRIQALADDTGAKIRYWSPWNEPNHPFFISPQRPKCSSKAPSASIRPYETMAVAMRDALEDGQELVLGEMAGLLKRKPGYTGVSEFIRGLDSELVCDAAVWSQHGYVGGPDPMEAVSKALARHDCPRAHALWVTETGVGAPRSGEERKASRKSLQRACRLIRGRLNEWFDDPRIDAAFQYTLREDDRFPTGLVTVDLAEAYPALQEWTAWAGEREPTADPPRSTCAGGS